MLQLVLLRIEAPHQVHRRESYQIIQKADDRVFQCIFISPGFLSGQLVLLLPEKGKVFRMFYSPQCLDSLKPPPQPVSRIPPLVFPLTHRPQIIYNPNSPSKNRTVQIPNIAYRFASLITSQAFFIMFANYYMNIQQEQSERKMEQSQTIDLKDELENDEESFGDLDENVSLQDEQAQMIVIDEETMESNDELVHTHNANVQAQSEGQGIDGSEGKKEASSTASEGELFYKGLISKLKSYSLNQQSLQDSEAALEDTERRYLQKIKIIYSHFVIRDQQLSINQFNHLKALLFVPKYGESLVRWGNKKYGHSLTLTLALERLDNLEKIAEIPPKRRFKEELRLLVMLAALLFIIKLLS